MPNSPRRHFLTWDRPLLPQAVAFLAGDWTGGSPLDLSRLLVVVPTRQSGRRLREGLAEHAARLGSAVFPPRVVTPEALVMPDPDSGAASRLQMLLAWMEVFRELDLTEFQEVFPHEPSARSFEWAMRLAEQFERLQRSLGENRLRLADVPARVGSDFPELDRWLQLAELERRYDERLRAAGLRDPRGAIGRMRGEGAAGTHESMRGGGTAPTGETGVWQGIGRVVVLATVDPLPASIAMLQDLPETVPVDVVVFAPESEAGHIDDWGRPNSETWAQRVLALPEFEQRVHLCSDPADQAVRVAELARRYRDARDGATDGALAVGVADPEVLTLVAGEGARRGVPVFDPEGESHRDGALYHLLAALADCTRRPTMEAVETLARCPDFLAYLTERGGPAFSEARFLAELDKLRQRHLPSDLAAARKHARNDVATGLLVMEEVRAELAQSDFPRPLARVLAAIFGARRVDPARESDAQLQDAAGTWTGIVRECAAAARQFPAVAAGEWWDIALRLFGATRYSPDKTADALELQGWLELLFEDAPHLVVAGLNDGLVPDAVVGDAFLPETLRARLGLKTNAARFARDAYLLSALSACRSEGGRIDVLFGKTSASGDPLRPSRLLLRCPDAELAQRVAFLFRTPEPPGSHLPWMRAWRVQPRVLPVPREVAVTSLRRWLACPFRFYLRSVLRMEAIDATKAEMDAFDFGTLCHAALEAMGRDAAMRDCTDPAVLREFLLAELAREARRRYGAELSLPLVIQLESARQRLGKFAELQARERAAGWVIQDVERAFAVPVGGLVVNGKIDRIDRNATTGAVRVLDYKTSDTAVTPAAAHVRTARAGEPARAWMQVPGDGRARVWTDLQLPLYRHALAAEFGGAITCGYVNLPKAVGETALAVWDDYTPELHAAAMQCAEGVCAAIRGGEYWPPNEDLRAEADDFAALFHHGVAESVAWEGAAG
ncbi:MAG TPA: PD-(D/E)XK nuclease family protein [Opitutaceae bacterium]|nr:PD-(D/E)XK nuclease family protein [Opitutaceae bacterium]